MEQLVKSQDPSTLQGFKKTTDKLMNDFGRYSEFSFSNISFPICPLSSNFSPMFDHTEHSDITQLLESFTREVDPPAQQVIQ